ncbi:MAG: NYN domain-containing protein [Deltaproteobacteria bacterium]|jgi:uncharacterized LabA/DUF88 family protein|nr:NYN domain-containing protein [Deltaproteobacteria bacterium]
MYMTQKPKLLVFVDEANITKAASKLFNKNFDWLKFRSFFQQYGDPPHDLVEMVVYVGLPPAVADWQDKRESKRNYVNWLKSQGFMVYVKEGSPKADGWYKANVDVIMAIDAVELSLRIKPNAVALVTGDADFAHLATTIRREGIKVEVASVPQILSGELKISANNFIDLTELFESFDDLDAPSQIANQYQILTKNGKETKNGGIVTV